MNCPDCNHPLRGDGSCCDRCGWTWHGGGDDPRLPSGRLQKTIVAEIDRREMLASVRQATAQLANSGRGHRAMRGLLAWLEADGIGLDQQNQDAVFVLLEATLGPFTGTARELMREALGDGT